MDRSEYLKAYKKYHYSKTRKIVTFPLLLAEFKELEARAEKVGMSTNTMAKEVVLAFLENSTFSVLTTEKKKLINDYVRISRGIAVNINQMAYSSNIGERVDVNVLVHSLKSYEDEFKALITKLENDK